ncbi:hypothetical protein RJ640_016738 [Escallonia rubra]|uniref:NAC domain-containing protein n=1 Tax=Escallonia rubra TaxID=112253 RepID=A0AA88UGE4_9ASTE|nr:hypothetical protein RJ640_016738 [Escallonia rubra]
MNTIPTGFKFQPTEEELLQHYLSCKVRGKPLPCEWVVTDCDLYDEKQLEEVFRAGRSRGGGEPMYFFTPLKKKGKDGTTRFDRTVGEMGCWHCQANRDILDGRRKSVIGAVRSFVFKRGESSSLEKSRERWNMNEYSLEGAPHYVICSVTKKKEKGGEKRKICHDHEDGVPDPQPLLKIAKHYEQSCSADATAAISHSFSNSAVQVPNMSSCLDSGIGEEGANFCVADPANDYRPLTTAFLSAYNTLLAETNQEVAEQLQYDNSDYGMLNSGYDTAGAEAASAYDLITNEERSGAYKPMLASDAAQVLSTIDAIHCSKITNLNTSVGNGSGKDGDVMGYGAEESVETVCIDGEVDMSVKSLAETPSYILGKDHKPY